MRAFTKPHILSLLLLIVVAAVIGLVVFKKWRHPSPSCPQELDLIIAGAEIIDGTGSTAVFADIGIKDQRIQCVGNLAGAKSLETIDATGLTVAPGFIDVHTHVERNVPTASPFMAPNFVHQGVTTVITGNCGRSFPDIAKFFRLLQRNGSQVNVATLIGHNTVRQSVMKQSSAAPSREQLQLMRGLLDRAMMDGALGMSTGLVYVPGTFADTEELLALTESIAAKGGIYVSHIRDEAAQGEDALREALTIGEKTGAHVHISHFKAQGPNQWGSAQTRLDLLHSARNRGVVVSLDQYPYNASSTGLAVLLPSWLSDGSLSTAQRKLGDPATRARVRREMLARLQENGWEDYSFARIAYYQYDRSLIGLSIAEVAERRLLADSPPHFSESAKLARGASKAGEEVRLVRQADAIIDLYVRGGAQMIFFDMAEADVKTIMRDPGVMFGSDSSVRGADSSALPHPRGLGTFPRVLGFYARQNGVLTIEEAVRRVTSLPASTFGISGRGYIRPDYLADLVIFDRLRVLDRATYEEPLRVPEGIVYVIINGTIVLDQSGIKTSTPGMVIRPNAELVEQRRSVAR